MESANRWLAVVGCVCCFGKEKGKAGGEDQDRSWRKTYPTLLLLHPQCWSFLQGLLSSTPFSLFFFVGSPQNLSWKWTQPEVYFSGSLWKGHLDLTSDSSEMEKCKCWPHPGVYGQLFWKIKTQAIDRYRKLKGFIGAVIEGKHGRISWQHLLEAFHRDNRRLGGQLIVFT